MTEIHGHCIACLGCKGLGLSAGRLTALETHTNFIHGCKIDISVTGLTGTYQPPFEPDAVIARMQQGPWPRPDYIQLAHKEKALLVCFAASCFTASSTIAASTTRKLRTGLSMLRSPELFGKNLGLPCGMASSFCQLGREPKELFTTRLGPSCRHANSCSGSRAQQREYVGALFANGVLLPLR